MASRAPSSLGPPLFALATVALASLLTACGSSGGGDLPTKPAATVLGAGDRISDVFGPAEWFDLDDEDSLSCSIPADVTVNITGVAVSAVDRFDEVSDGALGNMYVQDVTDEPDEYQGLTVFNPAFTPPDLRVTSGDVLDLFGVYMEFPGPGSSKFKHCRTLPELGGTGTFRFEGAHPVPKKVTLQEIFGYPNARRYLGMLVQLDNVTIGEEPYSSNQALPTGGRYTARLDTTGVDTTGVDISDYPQISNELYDIKGVGPVMTKGTTFKSVTGVLTYFFGFKIAPRSPDDFVP